MFSNHRRSRKCIPYWTYWKNTGIVMSHMQFYINFFFFFWNTGSWFSKALLQQRQLFLFILVGFDVWPSDLLLCCGSHGTGIAWVREISFSSCPYIRPCHPRERDENVYYQTTWHIFQVDMYNAKIRKLDYEKNCDTQKLIWIFEICKQKLQGG